MRRFILLILFFWLKLSLQAQDTYINNKQFKWTSVSSSYFTCYVEEGSYAAMHLDSLQKEMEKHRLELLSFFGTAKHATINTVFFVDTREKMKLLIGMDVQGFTIAEKQLVFFLVSEVYKAPVRHEFCHLYSYQVWGAPKQPWMNEGLAVCHDSTWSNIDIDMLAKHFKDRQKLFTISKLTQNLYSENAIIAYPQIGSYTKFILRKHGRDQLKEFWQRGISKNLLKQIEKDWLNELDKIDAGKINYLDLLNNN